MSKKLDKAAAEQGLYRSQLLRAALRHYIETNPDGYSAFDSGQQSTEDRSDSGSPENFDTEGKMGIYDPCSDEW